MKRGARRVLASLLVLTMAAAFVVGCQPTKPDTDKPPTEAKYKVGMVTDVGGLGDKGFNDAAYAALTQSKSELGAEIKAVSSKAMTDYDSNLAQLGNAEYDVIVCVGGLMGDAMGKAAAAFPNAMFIGQDIEKEEYLSNEYGLVFKEQEAGYMAGIVAGMLTKDTTVDPRINADNVIGFVGGMPIPPVQRYEAGFRAGAKSVNPDVTIISLYAGSGATAFNDQAKGKEMGLSEISQKADVIFAAAGNTGLGTIKACQEKGALFIGVDVDQFETVADSGDVMVTSAMKNMTDAIFEGIKAAKDGKFSGGTSKTFGIKEGAIELAPWHDFDTKIPQSVKDAVEKAKKDLTEGTVTVPTDPTKA